MLYYKLLKNHSGIMLCGDESTLRILNEVINDVNEKSPLITSVENSFVGFAYDVRKAFCGQRETISPPKDHPEIGVDYGVKILWPVILVHCRILRASLAYFDNTKIQQSVTYNLEALLEQALKEDFGNKSEILIDNWNRIDPSFPDIEHKIHSRGALFSSWSKTERKNKLYGMLMSFYSSYDLCFRLSPDTNLVPPEEYNLLNHSDWVDPRW